MYAKLTCMYKYYKEDRVQSMLNTKNMSTSWPCIVIFKKIGPHLQITHVNAENNHKLKAPKLAIEVSGGNMANKTRKTLFKEDVDIIILHANYLSTHNIW